ncbi:MAG: alpha-L-fucosidase [Planctomycetia bacterium]|nr:alpha-L-fucosidase [Planctomycetia bacterium]
MNRRWKSTTDLSVFLCRVAAAAILLATSANPSLAAEPVKESPADRDARMQWWRDARFGMFVHWGVYSVPAGVYQGKKVGGIGEWIKSNGNIPNEEYDKFVAQFDPQKFDAATFVRTAKQAGMKYLVITTKHHDGFCLWDSKVSDFDVVNSTPYHKDILKQLSDECKKQGLTLCFYYSIMDWHHPSQFIAAKGKHPDAGDGQTEMRKGMKQDYVDYMKAQLKELVTNYDPAMLWFDGEWVNWWTHEDGLDLYQYCRSLKPSILVNNRVDKGRKGMHGLTGKDKPYAGDFGTPEQEIPAVGLPGVDWESCMTINDTWGFKQHDHNWKSTEKLLQNLIDIASKGGNYLLNVGPTSAGQIPPESIERLSEIGQWMQVNGESIYGTSATPLGKQPWGRATQKPGRLYLHVFQWPQGRLELPPIANKITGAFLLADPKRQPLQVTQSDSSLFVLLPKDAPDKIASVIVLQIDGGVKLVAGK